jgi:hypothetical protein
VQVKSLYNRFVTMRSQAVVCTRDLSIYQRNEAVVSYGIIPCGEALSCRHCDLGDRGFEMTQPTAQR